MELTIEKALEQGIAAHKESKLEDAERLYRAILQSQPLHPDANHNLGVLAVSVNKADAALPLFKTALEANPKIEQFWLSYIDALIKTEKFDNAREALADAQQAGVSAAKLQIFEAQPEFELPPGNHIPQQEINNPLHSHQGELSAAIELREVGKYKEAQEWLSKVIEHDTRNIEALSLLSQVLLLDKKEAEAARALTAAASINSELPTVYRNQARLLLKQSKTAEALERAQLGCRQSPEDSESLLVLAACLGANQRDLEALPIIEKILKAKPNYAEAYANRALIKLRAKDTVGAIEDAKMTVSIKPHLTQMWQLLGSLYYQANNLSDAIEALRRAHKNEPENPDFMVQLGEFLRQDDKASEAITILEQATELAPKDANAWTNLGVAFQQEKRIADAKIAYEKALALNSKSAAISSNLGAMAKEAEEWESALQYFEKALEIEPDFAEAHSNLGTTLKELGRLDEAEASYKQAIALKPDYVEAHSNLGATLQELGRLHEAEASCIQAIELKPDYAEAHYNLGVTLKELGRLDEAEASYTQAIALKPDYAEAHYNLGNTLKELGRLDEALASYTQAIAMKPDFAEAHSNLGIVLYISGDIDSALVSMKKANSINPKLDTYELINSIIQARKSRKETEVNADNIISPDCGSKLTTNLLILSRLVERELITVLLQMKSRGLDSTDDARYGNGRCSPDFNLFKEDHPIIRTVAEDLISIMKSYVKSDIYFSGTFFNVLSAGGGSSPHNHLKEIDGDHGLFLGRQKYSLVYYLSVGDQNCSEPGTLKLFDPDEDILPCEGMIIIIPASRKHSAIYGGETDRIMIGVNFYSI